MPCRAGPSPRRRKDKGGAVALGEGEGAHADAHVPILAHCRRCGSLNVFPGGSGARRGDVSGEYPAAGPTRTPSEPVAPSFQRPAAVPLVSWRSLPLVLVPAGATTIAILLNTFIALDYVHVICGGLWTGIDLFMGLVIGPVLARMPGPARADFVQRLVPTMLFLMPTLASVTITAGIYLAVNQGIFNLSYPAIQLAGILVIALVVQGIGIFLPNELRIVFELRKPRPDITKVGRWGLLNARLAGLQAAFQIALIFVMANLAAGNVHLAF